MSGFGGMKPSSGKAERRQPDCLCMRCDRWFHHLGIMRHRSMHREKGEDCKIAFSDGRVVRYRFSNA